jgi:bifunctional non-homologous end joining protein LigD
LYSRNQNDFKKRFPTIAHAVKALDNVILDGEICALDEQGHPRFEWLVNRGPQQGKLVYYVFDLLRLGDKDLRSEPLYRRKSLIQKILKKNDTLATTINNRRTNHVRRSLGAGQEGIVAKDPTSPYVQGPIQTWHWQKIKNKDYRQGKVEFRQSR